MEKTTINSRIQQIISSNQLTISSFSRKIGLINGVTISKIINQKRKPSAKTIGRIINALPDINYDWLINGKGEMLKENKNKIQSVNNDELTVTSKQVIDFISTDIKDYIDNRVGKNTEKLNLNYLNIKEVILSEINTLIKNSHNNTMNRMKKLYKPMGFENILNEVDQMKQKSIITTNNFIKAHSKTVKKIDDLQIKINKISKAIKQIETYNLLEEKRKEKIDNK